MINFNKQSNLPKFLFILSVITRNFLLDVESKELRNLDLPVSNEINRRKLSPKDIGDLHTDAFRKLSEMYRYEKPKTSTQLLDDIYKLTASYCLESDELCIAAAYEQTIRATQVKKPDLIDYPDDFDPFVATKLEEIYATIDDIPLREGGLDETVELLSQIENDLMLYSSSNENEIKGIDQEVGLVAASVAIESSKLWYEVFHDESHPLHEMQGSYNFFSHHDTVGNHRLLQDQVNVLTALPLAILMDVYSVWEIVSSYLSLDILGMITFAIGAIPFSAIAFFTAIFSDHGGTVVFDDDTTDDDTNTTITNSTNSTDDGTS